MTIKFELDKIRESRNRQFYALRANNLLVATHLWTEKHGQMLQAALTCYAETVGEKVVLDALEEEEG